MKFTWIETYKHITQWLKTKRNDSKELIEILKTIGVDGFKDIDEEDNEFELDEIDPFSFFAYLNKYKTDKKRIEILQKLHKELNFDCAKPEDVEGIPTSHPLKVRLFPYKRTRGKNDILNLWNLFIQVDVKEIDNDLFQKVLLIKSVGKNKLSISFFYINPEYYVPLDSRTIAYLRANNLQYSFDDINSYLNISEKAKNDLELKPYEISYNAWENKNIEVKSSDDDNKNIGSVRTLLHILDKLNDEEYSENVEIFYRGHSSSKFEIKPYIYRTGNLIKNEDILFKNIIARSPIEFKDCDSTFEKLVKMQHYSLPTRLLDITSNPLVALFFACKDEGQENEDGKLFRFVIKENEIKYFDSDTVSVIANISRRPISFSIKHIDEKCNRDNFNEEEVIEYLLHEIRAEKPHFSPAINREHLEMVFCVKPKLDNPRIIRQEGAFFIFGMHESKNNPAIFNFEHTSYLINKSEKKKILKQLDALGINESTLFPEIEHVAKHLKEKYNIQSKTL